MYVCMYILKTVILNFIYVRAKLLKKKRKPCRVARETYTVIKSGKQQFSAGNILRDFYAWTVKKKKKEKMKKKKEPVLNWRSMAT